MPIPRFHLFELEDQAWFPNIVRDLATDYLEFMEGRLKLHQPVVPLLARALRESDTTTVLDLCAGGGGHRLHARGAGRAGDEPWRRWAIAGTRGASGCRDRWHT